MIAQKFRLHRWRVQKLLKQPNSKKIGFFIVKYKPNRLLYNRWAIVISKKVEKRAVIRNLKRRQIYESIRLQTKAHLEDKVDFHFDLVLIPYKEIVSCNYEKIGQNTRDILKFLLSIKS
ncbi:ribonuclease P protein component [bacterium]|nr:ribonuclease P protein component [bacterium]